MDIITGEKFQYLCDIYIGSIEFNPKNHIFNSTLNINNCIHIDDINNLNNLEKLFKSKKIFIYTHLLRKNENFLKILELLQKKESNFILVFHNSDDTLNNKYIDFINKTKCIKIFGQNLDFENINFQYLPIGLANSKWKHGNIPLFNSIISKNIIKDDKIFFNFTIHTNYKKRNDCYNKLKNKIHFKIKYNNQEEYLLNLKKCKYCICPDGNGYDTHRLWECLYLDVIPICKDSTFIRIIAKDFPILILEDWNNLEINSKLFNNYDLFIQKLDKNKLNFNYWKNIIHSIKL